MFTHLQMKVLNMIFQSFFVIKNYSVHFFPLKMFKQLFNYLQKSIFLLAMFRHSSCQVWGQSLDQILTCVMITLNRNFVIGHGSGRGHSVCPELEKICMI